MLPAQYIRIIFMAGLLTYRDNPNLSFPAPYASGNKIQLYLQLREQLRTNTYYYCQ